MKQDEYLISDISVGIIHVDENNDDVRIEILRVAPFEPNRFKKSG